MVENPALSARLRRIASASSLILILATLSARPAQAAALVEWTVPGLASPLPYGVALDPSLNVWFTELNGEAVGKFKDGLFTIYDLSSAYQGGRPWDLAWVDGKIWFTDELFGLCRLSPDGTLERFMFPPAYGAPLLRGIAVEDENNVWFAMYGRGSIGLLHKDGGSFKVKEWRLKERGGKRPGPTSIIYLEDSGAWYVDFERSVVGNIPGRLENKVREWLLPLDAKPWDIAADSLGNLWFTEPGRNKVAKLGYPLNEIVEYEIPTPDGEPYGITVDASNKVWFTERSANKIACFTPGINVFTEFGREGEGAPCFIAAGGDSSIWYTVAWDRLGRLDRRFGLTTTLATWISTAPASSTAATVSTFANASTFSPSSLGQTVEREESYTTSTSYSAVETVTILHTSTTLVSTISSTIIQVASTSTVVAKTTLTLYATKTVYATTTTIATTVVTTVFATETVEAAPIPGYSSPEILVGVAAGALALLALRRPRRK